MNKLNSEQMARLSEIAAYLQQKRLELSLPLEYVQQRTQIRVTLLQAIEEGKFEVLPEPVYIKGFIRLYGNAIGVDGDALAHNFIQASQPTPVQTNANGAKLPRVDAFTPSLTIPDRLSERLRLRYSIPYLVLLLVATSILSWLVKQPTKEKQIQTQTPSEPESESKVVEKPSSINNSTDSSSAKIPQEKAQTENSAPSPQSQVSQGQIADQKIKASLSTTTGQEETKPPLSNPTPSENPSNAQPNPTPSPNPTQPLSVQMKLQGGDSWLRVTVDGKAVYEGILKDGEQKIWNGQGEIKIRSGNAGVVMLSTNQGQTQAMGNPGEVKEITIN